MSIQIWNEDEIISIANKHLNFLAFLYPFLKESSYHREVVEIRPIGRDKEKAPYIESFNVFRIDEDTISRYIKFLEKINGKPYCLYYSSHCFDNKKDIEGKKRTKINNECFNGGDNAHNDEIERALAGKKRCQDILYQLL